MAKQFNQPILKRDADSNVIQESYLGDMTFRGEYTAGQIIYRGLSRPGADTDDPVWQIAKFTYSGTDLTQITWPEGSNGAPSSEFIFIWDNRALYTYS